MRAFTRLSDRNPLLAMGLGALVCAALYLAWQWDRSDARAIYWQTTNNVRSVT